MTLTIENRMPQVGRCVLCGKAGIYHHYDTSLGGMVCRDDAPLLEGVNLMLQQFGMIPPEKGFSRT